MTAHGSLALGRTRGVEAIQPFLRWAGSKRKLLPKLTPYWGTGHDRYIEPFVGSACLYYALAPRDAILGDINDDLIRMYVAVRDAPSDVYSLLTEMPVTKEHYYHIRSLALDTLSEVERAARFIFLNRHCFNGLYRTNLQGQFNVPFAPERTGPLPTWDDLLAAAKALECAKLVCGDFEDVASCAGEGDLVYLDPPYAVRGRRVFREYGARCFGPDDLQRLVRMLEDVSARGAHFVVSYADCPEARQAFSEWHTTTVTTHRNIAGFAQYRRCDSELLASNFVPESARDQS